MNIDYSDLQEYKVSLLLTPEGKQTEVFIDNADILDLVIIWDYNDTIVEGYIIYKDSMKHLEFIPPNNNLKLKIKVKDALDVEFERIFIISNIDKDFDGSKHIGIKLEFIDEYYNMLCNTYVSKGYNNKDVAEIYKELLDQSNKLVTKKLPINMKNEGLKKYENYIVMGNKNLMANIHNAEKMDDIILINQRRNLTIIPSDNIGKFAYDLTKGIVFSPDPQYENTPFFAHKVNINYVNNLNYNIMLPKSKSYQVNSKEIIIQEHNESIVHKKLNIGTKIAIKDGTIGNKLFPYSNNIVDSIYNTSVLESFTITFEVSGNFSLDLLQKVSFESNSTVEKLKSKMPYVTGEYFIIKIIDRISGGDFKQIITLGRIGAK